MRRSARIGVALVAAVLGAPVAAVAASAELRVCFRDRDLPRAERQGERGFDVAVMRAVAAELGLELAPVWLASRPPFSEIDDSDLPLDALTRGDCDAVASVPGELAIGGYGGAVTLTRPYYGAGFELVGPDRLPDEIEALVELERPVAVLLQSLGHFALQGLGVSWQARPTVAEVLSLLDSGEAAAALVWGPALSPFGRRAKVGWQPPQGLRFNEHVAMRAGDPLAERVDAVLAELLEADRVAGWAAESRMIYHPPFPSASDRPSLRALGIGGGRRP